MNTKHHIEQEIKLTAPDQATLEQIMASDLVRNTLHHDSTATAPKTFAAIYYDTPAWHLRELRWSLRTRDEGDRHVSTLKRNSTFVDGFSSCEEIEQAVDKSFECVTDIPPGKIADSIRALFPRPTPLLPRVHVNMQRSKHIILIGNTSLELVTDSGFIKANGKQYDLFELELELLEGDLQSDDIQAFVTALIRQFSLQKSQASKHQIGLSFY